MSQLKRLKERVLRRCEKAQERLYATPASEDEGQTRYLYMARHHVWQDALELIEEEEELESEAGPMAREDFEKSSEDLHRRLCDLTEHDYTFAEIVQGLSVLADGARRRLADNDGPIDRIQSYEGQRAMLASIASVLRQFKR